MNNASIIINVVYICLQVTFYLIDCFYSTFSLGHKSIKTSQKNIFIFNYYKQI